MDLPEGQQIYRYWVELRERRKGFVRELPLQALKRIHLPKKGAPQLPDELVLEVNDGADVVRAQDIDGLAAQLRLKYPDETHERLLHCERDRQAERRKADAMEALIGLLAKAALEDVLREEAELHKEPSRGERDRDTTASARDDRASLTMMTSPQLA